MQCQLEVDLILFLELSVIPLHVLCAVFSTDPCLLMILFISAS